MTGRLRPLWTPGGGRGSGRPPGVPKLVSPQPANAAVWFEDFVGITVAPVVFGEGTVADPATVLNQVAYGHPAWIIKAIAGTGTAGQGGMSQNFFGTLQLVPSSASGDGLIADLGGRTTTSATCSMFGVSNSSVMMSRCALSGGLTLRNDAWGWPATSIAQGTDWFTDPDTTLAATNSIVITRHIASYSGDAAGDLVGRLYESSGVDTDSVVLLTSAQVTTISSGGIKVEVQCTGGNLNFYINDVLAGTIDIPNVAANSIVRPSFGNRTTGVAANRVLNMDCFYSEVGLTTAR